MKYDRDTLVEKIAQHEGLVLEPYKDSLGISTIGIGRNLEGRGIDDYELMHMNKTLDEIISDGLTKEEAYYLCNNDIDIVEQELVKQKPLVMELDEARQMCLVDMGFNLGIPKLNPISTRHICLASSSSITSGFCLTSSCSTISISLLQR